MMDDKERCQSCGMPLGAQVYGSNADGSNSVTFCKFCFQDGVYTNLSLTLEEMIDISITHMIGELHISKEEAVRMANLVIPQLDRWNSEKKSVSIS